jgi:adenine-specific DNA-methyltransferase
MSDAYFGNKKMRINQRRYLGSKTKLLGFIDEILKSEKAEFRSFADIFAGTGSVANYYYDKSNIIINDILESNYQSYVAYFGKERIRSRWLLSKLKEYNNIDLSLHGENYFSENFSNTYFDYDNAKKIGVIRENIEELFNSNLINRREKSYLLTSLIYALDKIANTVGHYDAYRKIQILPRSLILYPLDIVETKHKSKIFKMDANELVRNIQADVIYIDPPYNSRQYSDSYHLLENIATWSKQPVYGVAKKIDRSHLKSHYSLKSAGDAFGDLIDNIDAKYILVSYNDMGNNGDVRSQSRISDHEIVSALERRGRVKVYEKSFNQFTTGRSSKDDLKERVFFCEVGAKNKKSPALTVTNKNSIKQDFVKSPLNYTGGKHKLLPQITKYFPDNIDTFFDIFCGGANVGINAKSHKIICIDKDKHVIELLKLIQSLNFEELHQEILSLINRYCLSQSYINGYNVYGAESSGGLGLYNKSKYIKLRESYNNSIKTREQIILLLVLIMYSFNNQIRFNSKGEFNLPVGKRDYNGSSRKNLASFNQASNSKDIKFISGDFRDLLTYDLSKKDFVYLDPPYLIGLASYNENGGWSEKDENDLYEVLLNLNKNGVRFALSNVVEHKGEVNHILKRWVEKHGFNVHSLQYNYRNSNYQSTAKNGITREVLVTNY